MQDSEKRIIFRFVSAILIASRVISSQEKSIKIIQTHNIKRQNMDKKKNENFFLKLIKIKKEIRDCVQNGRDLKDVEKNYGIRFSKPL